MSFTIETTYTSKQTATPAQPSTEAVDGTSTEMDLWSFQREDLLLAAIRGAPWTNSSSYTLPEAMAPVSRYDRTISGVEKASTAPSDPAATDGSSSVMDVWTESRTVRLNTVFSGNYTNKSEFPVPRALVDVSRYNRQEKRNGAGAIGQGIGPNGLPISGTAELVDGDGNVIGSATAAGGFIVGSAPPSGVTEGKGGDGVPSKVDLVFTPKADAVEGRVENYGYLGAAYENFYYGYIYGWVTDNEGEPVQDVPVIGEGAYSTSDGNGRYTLLAPSNANVTLESLSGTLTQTVSVPGGSEGVEVSWQFGGIQVRVLGPKLEPVPSAPIAINGEVYKTDETGKIKVTTMPIGDHTVVAMDEFERQVTIEDQGELVKESFDGGSRLILTAYDAVSGEPIANTTAIDVSTGILSYSNRNGKASLIQFKEGDFQALLGYEDRRYVSESREVTVPNGEVEDIEVELERKPAVTNA